MSLSAVTFLFRGWQYDCDASYVFNMAESKMVEFKMTAIYELRELRLSLSLWYEYESVQAQEMVYVMEIR